MLYALLKTVHVLSILVWIGGMVFAHFFLRPALTVLESGARVRLMHAVLGRFFNAVLVLATLTLVTGSWMIVSTARQMALSEAKFHMPLEWTVMATLGLVMVLIFGHIRFALYKRLSTAVTSVDWPAGAAALGQIRLWVGVNMVLGGLIVLVTVMGIPR